jgi:interleukin-1 receptor-associated kinase 1
LRAFEQAELEKATGGFASHSKLAEGTFGIVFRSDTLVSGRSVAIKVLKPGAASKMQDCAEEWTGAGTFRKELEVLGNYQHHNIVELLGYCLGCNSNQHPPSGCLPFNQAAMTVMQQPCLVFEFMAGGSLGMRLRAARDDRSAAAPLSCAERFGIASDVARGLEYLHTADPPLIHQDVKSDNILLCYFQGCLVAKVADFGTARFAPALLERGTHGALETHHSTQNVVGTRPYMPSEYTHLGHVSEKTDAFAFGVVLCELLTGLPPANHDAGEMLATTMPRPLADAERLLPPMLDKRIGGNDNMWPPLRAITLGRVAARCIEPDVSSRCVVAAVRPELDALAGREGQIGGTVVPNPRLVSNERGVRLAHDTASVERPLVPGASGTTGAGLERVESDTLGYQARSDQPLTASTTEQTDGGRPVNSPRIVSNERGVRLAHDTASAERPLVPASSSQDYS